MKCSAACRFYQVYVSSDDYKVVCALRGFTIRDIKNKFPDIYKDCQKFKKVGEI